MKVWIQLEAITTSTSKYLPKGLVHFCSSLQSDGFCFACKTDSLTKRQKAQLKIEDIFADFASDDSDGIIEFDKSEGKLKFWIGDSVIANGYDFPDLLSSYQAGLERIAEISRTTNETDISIELNLDGTGKNEISTGLKFFDHMLEQIARHGFVDLNLTCDGDLEVDEHHTIEDVAIALGDAITQALGDKKGIERYAFVLPMDETQATVALDLSGRPYLTFEGDFNREYVGDMPTEMVKHFFYSLAMNLKLPYKLNSKVIMITTKLKPFSKDLHGYLKRPLRKIHASKI